MFIINLKIYYPRTGLWFSSISSKNVLPSFFTSFIPTCLPQPGFLMICTSYPYNTSVNLVSILLTNKKKHSIPTLQYHTVFTIIYFPLFGGGLLTLNHRHYILKKIKRKSIFFNHTFLSRPSPWLWICLVKQVYTEHYFNFPDLKWSVHTPIPF